MIRPILRSSHRNPWRILRAPVVVQPSPAFEARVDRMLAALEALEQRASDTATKRGGSPAALVAHTFASFVRNLLGGTPRKMPRPERVALAESRAITTLRNTVKRRASRDRKRAARAVELGS